MEKTVIVKYVRLVKKLFVIFSCVMIPAVMVSLILAVNGYVAFYAIAPVLAVGYLVVYGLYAMRVSMSVVLAMDVTDEVVHLKTKRKTFTYDAKRGCVGMKAGKKKFVGTFRTQDSQDSFIFLRRVPFAKRYETGFTAEEMRRVYPALAEDAEETE